MAYLLLILISNQPKSMSKLWLQKSYIEDQICFTMFQNAFFLWGFFVVLALSFIDVEDLGLVQIVFNIFYNFSSSYLVVIIFYWGKQRSILFYTSELVVEWGKNCSISRRAKCSTFWKLQLGYVIRTQVASSQIEFLPFSCLEFDLLDIVCLSVCLSVWPWMNHIRERKLGQSVASSSYRNET